MASRVLKLRTLRRALEILDGDERTLARKLRVPTLELHGFLMGEENLPTWLFLAAVDVVTDGVARQQGSRVAPPAPLELVEEQMDRAEEGVAGRLLSAG
jgi:hypothetical protein